MWGKRMRKKIIGIFVCMLLIGTTLPIISSSYSKVNSRLQGFSSNLPDYFSWKDDDGKDWTTPAKNQGVPKWCGSCWIFSAIGILESVINIKEGSADINPDLSEQYVLSCLPEAGNGCSGGFPYDVLSYIMDTSSSGNNCNGIIWESCFPYQADDSIPCDDKCPNWEVYLVPIYDRGYWISNESPDNIEIIKTQIIENGPVVASMLFNNEYWYWGMENHDSEDYYPYEDEYGVDHDKVIVGWKDNPLIPNGGYWITKDSYGTDFGYDGFINMEYGLLGSLWIDENPDTTYIVWVDYDPESFSWPNEPGAPSQPKITGETNGKVETEYEYMVNAEDPNNYDLKYHIDWGDGTSETTDFNLSGMDVIVKHIWKEKGAFDIKVTAENTIGKIGPVGTLTVSMPKTHIHNPIIDLLIGIFEHIPFFEKILNQILI